MTGVDFRRAMIACLELRGNAYALISERDRQGYASRLDLLDPDQVSVVKGDTDVFYSIAGRSLLPSRDIIHLKGFTLDGIEGKSPITLLRENIENARNSKRFSKNLFKRDLKTSTVFSTDEKISPAQRMTLQSDLNKMLNKAKGVGSPIVLEGGMKVSSLTLSPEDAQFVQYSLMTTDEIAAGYRVPPHKVGDWTRGTYSNNTQANLEYFTDCVRPLLEVCEAELNEKLLLEAERADVYVDINFKGLLRTDVKTQIENYRTMFNIGVYSANDIRALEDLAGYPGGDRYFVPANMMEITAQRLITPQNDIQNNGQSE
jgi:HK97 family phage portal protein